MAVCARISIELQPEGRADRRARRRGRPDPGHHAARRREPPIAILAYTDSLPVRTLVYPLADLQPRVPGDAAGRRRTTPRRVHRPAVRHLPRAAGRGDRADRRSRREASEEARTKDRRSRRDEPTRAADARAGAERRSLYEQIRRAGRRARLRDLLGAALRAQPAADDSYRRAALEFGQALRELEEDRRAGGRRTSSAKRTCGGGSTRRSPAGVQAGADRRRRRRVSRAGARAANIPAMTDEELASLRAAVEQADADAVFVLQAVVAVGLRRRQPRAGVFRAALGGAAIGRGCTNCRCRYLVARRPAPARGGHASLDGGGDRRRAAGANAVGAEGRPGADARATCATRPSRCIGHGELSTINEALAHVDVGTAIGELPEGRQPDVDPGATSSASWRGSSWRSIKHDGQAGTDARPAREPPRQDRGGGVSRPAPLVVLPPPARAGDRLRQAVGHAAAVDDVGREVAPAVEPESEIALVEAVLLGETVELATAYKFKTHLESCDVDRRRGADGPRRLPVRPDEVDGPGPAAACRNWPPSARDFAGDRPRGHGS